MAPRSRKARLQQYSWQVLDDLAFCTQRYPRLAELAAQVLVERPPLPAKLSALSDLSIRGPNDER